MSVPLGGPATINGIIYQMLWSLLETSTIQIKDCDAAANGEKATKAQVILEPVSGGDTLICYPNTTIVQQLKAKSGGGAWSLHSLVVDVLPDLYRAVQLDQTNQFQFVTEGHQGDWKQVEVFFKELATRSFPGETEDVLAILDATRKIKFRGSLKEEKTPPNKGNLVHNKDSVTELSEPELFKAIAGILRKKDPAKQETENLTYRKLWKLLSLVQFRWDETFEKLEAQLLNRLRAVVDNSDTLKDTLRTLLMALAEKASKGEAKIEASSFFSEHGLDAIPLTQWPRIVQASSNLLKTTLSGQHYHTAQDVRPLPIIEELDFWNPVSSPFLVFTGESGQGKTWRLCALARSVSTNTPVVLFKSMRNGKDDVEKAARSFWQDLCGHDSEKSLNSIAYRVIKEVPSSSNPWLYLFIDNVLNIDEAKDLYEEFLSIPGVCIAFSAPKEIAEGFKAYAQDRASLIPVPDFTDNELINYVADGDLMRWHDIPDVVREIIRRPLLADLYCRLTDNGVWTPMTEYDLFARSYQEHFFAPIKQYSPTAIARMKKAVLAVWDGENYPWSIDQLVTLGFHDEMIHHLVVSGWLRFEGTRYEIWHDRLLNWHIAEMIMDALEQKQLDVTAVGEKCAELLWKITSNPLRGLSYVAMDLVWMLAKKGETAKDLLDKILDILDRGHSVEKVLYEFLLPTVGTILAPAMFRRLAQVEGPGRARTRREIAKTLSTMDADRISPEAIRLLRSEDGELRRVGAEIFSRRPSGQALNRLWQRYCVLSQDKTQKYAAKPDHATDNFQERRDIWRALKECIVLASEWLETTLLRTNPIDEPVGILVDLLYFLPDGKARWLRNKDSLRDNVKEENAVSFARAVYYWNDVDEASWIRQRMTEDNAEVGSICLRALARFAPMSILQVIRHTQLHAAQDWIVGELVASIYEAFLQGTYEVMRNADVLWKYAQLFAGHPDSMTEEILKLLLDNLFPRLLVETEDPIWSEIGLIAHVCRLSLLKCLWECTEPEWDSRMAQLIIEHRPLPAFFHNITLEATVNLLYKLGGEGFTQVVNHWLAAEEVFAQRYGTQHAFKRPDMTTVQLLKKLALANSESKPEDPGPCSYDAQQALALCEAWQAMVETIVLWGEKSNREILHARYGVGPLSNEDMLPATLALMKEPKHPGAIIALGFGQRTDAIPQLVKMLNEEDPNTHNEVTNACTWALVAMQTFTPEVVDAFVRRLRCSEGQWLVVRALCESGNETAMLALLEYLQQEMQASRDNFFSRGMSGELTTIICCFLEHPITREEAVTLCRQIIGEDPGLNENAQKLVGALTSNCEQNEGVIAVLDSKAVRDFLFREAFKQSNTHQSMGNKISLINGLAAFGAEEAYVAALRFMKSSEMYDREYIPYILLHINRERAIADLLQHISRERQTILRLVCARALCEVNAQDVLLGNINDIDAALRRAVCFALGFAEPTSIVIAAVQDRLNDEDVKVYETAVASLHKLRKSRNAQDLAKAFREESDASRRWILLDAALEIGDLGDVSRPAPEWIQQMCSDLPQQTSQYVSKKIHERREKEIQEAKRDDWHDQIHR